MTGQVLDSAQRRTVARWIAAHIMPHEASVRAWLCRALVSRADRDDLIQEAYCRLSASSDLEKIARPDGYFFQVVRNLLHEQLKRSARMKIDTSILIDALPHDDEAPSAERVVQARQEWSRVLQALETLPERCKIILKLRKLEGLSQREIAERLGVTESIVENDAIKGMRLILQGLSETPNSKTKKERT